MDEIIAAWNRNPAFAQDLQFDPKSPEVREELKKTDPRAWWEYDRDRTLALGVGDTFDVVRGALEKQRFDVRVEYMGTSRHTVTDTKISVSGGLWVQVG